MRKGSMMVRIGMGILAIQGRLNIVVPRSVSCSNEKTAAGKGCG